MCLTGPCNPHANCNKTGPGTFSCKCKPGYVGNGMRCIEVDACLPNPCHEKARCSRTGAGQSACTCNPGFNGDGKKSCVENDPCSSNPCHKSGGICTKKSVTLFSCKCKPGWLGDGFRCELLEGSKLMALGGEQIVMPANADMHDAQLAYMEAQLNNYGKQDFPPEPTTQTAPPPKPEEIYSTVRSRVDSLEKSAVDLAREAAEETSVLKRLEELTREQSKRVEQTLEDTTAKMLAAAQQRVRDTFKPQANPPAHPTAAPSTSVPDRPPSPSSSPATPTSTRSVPAPPSKPPASAPQPVPSGGSAFDAKRVSF